MQIGDTMAYNIIFYEKENGKSETWDQKSQKTPRREIEKAKTERNDYLTRKENEYL